MLETPGISVTPKTKLADRFYLPALLTLSSMTYYENKLNKISSNRRQVKKIMNNEIPLLIYCTDTSPTNLEAD